MSDETVYKADVRRPQGETSLLSWLLIGGGVLLLVANLAHFSFMSILWPGLFIAPGLLMLWPAYTSTSQEQSSFSFLAIPGAVLTSLGLMFFVMNLTDHWESWAYAWTLLPAAAVAGLMYMKRFEESSRVHESGYRVLRALIIAFMGLSIFFELFVFRGLGEWWPTLLVGLGVYLLVKERRNK